MCSEKFFNRRIGKLAFKLYKARGNAPGSEKEDWIKAERLVKNSFLFKLCTYVKNSKKSLAGLVIFSIAVFFFGIVALRQSGRALIKQEIDREQGNRPRVEMSISKIDVIRKELNRVTLPELRFSFACTLLNYGNAPAFVKNVELILKNVDLQEFAVFKLYPTKEGKKQKVSFDLASGVRKAITLEPSIGIDQIENIMQVYMQDLDARNNKSPFWKKKDSDIVAEFKKRAQPFSLVAQVEYYASDDRDLSNPYFYSVQLKVNRQLESNYYKCAERKWLMVGEDGAAHWIY